MHALSVPVEVEVRRTACLLCPGMDGIFWREVNGHRLLRCPSCGMGWTERIPTPAGVAEIYGDRYFAGDADGYPDYVSAESGHRATARAHLAVLAELHPARGRLLDVGCAAGFMLDEARRCGFDVLGVELSARMVAYARDWLALDVVRAPYLDAAIPPESVDVVTALQVLEHAVEPLRWLRRAARQLRPGGTLLVETWDADSLTARIAGERWQQLSPPSVQFWFNRRGLAGLFAEAGFEVASIERAEKYLTIARGLALLEDKYLPSLKRRLQRALAGTSLARRTVRYPLDDLVRVVARRR